MTVSNFPTTGNLDDTSYHALLENMQVYALGRIGDKPVFTTDADIWSIYLAQLPVDLRQYHNCHACQKFIETYGGLVTISASGQQTPVFWWPGDSLAEPFYASVFAAMYAAVKQAKVTGVFVSTEKRWGTPVTGIWRHFGMPAPQHLIWRGLAQTASQHAAEKLEDYKNLRTALTIFSLEHVQTAVRVLESDTLYRSEKVLGAAQWFLALKEKWTKKRKVAERYNLLWLIVATAPAGFCHPRSSMIGTLLDDIAAGMSYEQVAARFAEKMHPLRYQRPQAAPAAGNVAQAEKIIAQLQAAGSLRRRYAYLEDMTYRLWEPHTKPTAPATGGVFGAVLTKQNTARPTTNNLTIPAITMTLDKFRRTVLPEAEKLELYTSPGLQGFAGFLTTADFDAPPILQWDSPEQRQPVSWYFWSGRSTPRQFGLLEKWYDVAFLTTRPPHWHKSDGFTHYDPAVVFVIPEAHDVDEPSLCLFPEILKSELHGVRSTLESYSRMHRVEGERTRQVAGLVFDKDNNKGTRLHLRVTARGIKQEYILDRWD